MRKLRLNTAYILSLCLLFACNEGDDVLDSIPKVGKVTFQLKDDPREAIRLSNARTQKDKDAVYGPFLDIIKEGAMIHEKLVVNDIDVLELPVGTYTARIYKYEQMEKYKGNLALDGSERFTITADNESRVNVYMYRKYMVIHVELKNLDGAKAWLGEKGFTPDASNQLPHFFPEGGPHTLYADDEFDLVVEFEGEQKRYTTEANLAGEYYITIINNSDEQPESGNAMFTYEVYSEDSGELFTYTWD